MICSQLRFRATPEEFGFAFVARERGRAFEFHARLVEAGELFEQIAAHARQQR